MLTLRHTTATLTNTMRTDELDYYLPDDRIATHPVEPRDACKLLVCSRTDSTLVEHRVFRELPAILHPSDLLVTNASGVLPARLEGHRTDSGGAVRGIYIEELAPGRWRCLLRTNGVLRHGQQLELRRGEATPPVLATINELDGEGWALELDTPEPAAAVLARIGVTPLPPYILARRKALDEQVDDTHDRDWYRTVYAEPSATGGSVAAPTAGLHFTPRLLTALRDGGVDAASITLDVGIGTFAPITADRIEAHAMHAERCRVPAETIAALHRARSGGARTVAVGTTVVRTLESLPDPPPAGGWSGDTELFITPGFAFQRTDALITNFHLPRSTLLAMVGALFDGGVPRLLGLYTEAIRQNYRFYSYGDAMLILP
ncbi:MAG: tRNA preQ1(34) S-adenosylmethionine ribosyltransferase-isomerase QueA [Planctomycetota bacterium]